MIQEKYFPHFVTLTLLVLSAAFKNAAMAYACVTSLFLILGKDTYDRISAVKEVKDDKTEEYKRSIADLNARLVRIEHGIATRGF